MTSHDVVNEARRLYGTRAVGHAGTLDPMASGVLVLVFGEATKLAAHLTAADKEYRATVTFGRGTDTLDADGRATSEQPLANGWLNEDRLAASLDAERTRTWQSPPEFSAISVGGERSYRRARRGEPVALEPRAVSVEKLDLVGRDARSLTFVLTVSKGYYVRAFARDVGLSLGVPAHLSELVRLSSGPFRIEEAVPWPPTELPELLSLPTAARAVLPAITLSPSGVERARVGKHLSEADFVGAPPADETSAWFAEDGRLIALGGPDPDRSYRVRRGFADPHK